MSAHPRFDDARLDRIEKLLERWVDDGDVPAATVVIGTSRETVRHFAVGHLEGGSDKPLPADPIFLIASPTKPITALAVLLLAERGELKLVDPVARYVPDFAPRGKRSVTLAHCLTHTSGLPDQLPDNVELRARNAPPEEFVRRVCELELNFRPGRDVQYQSMGYLMLGEVVRTVTGRSLAEFLHEEFFGPLEMHDAALGMPPAWETSTSPAPPPRRERIARLPVEESVPSHEAIWNSDYWRRFGAPWGGLLATATDLAKLSRHLLSIHAGDAGLLSPTTVAAMCRNQLQSMPDVPEAQRRSQPWGYGWRLNWPAHATSFGDLLSPAAYGHWGATGTLVWIDPQRDLFTVALTTAPLESGYRRLTNLSNAVCGAIR